MKTSNKLIIALAALFFLVPLVGMVYETKNYIDAKDFKFKTETPKQFSDQLEGHIAQALGSFTAVSVADAMDSRVTVSFIKDAKYGVKMREDYKDYITFNVNANGILEVKFIKKPSSGNFINLMIYAPVINGITIANAKGLDIPGDYDSLKLVLNNVRDFNLREGNTYKHLTIDANSVPDLAIWSAKVDVLALTLNNSSFQTDGNNYRSLTINASGIANISMEEREENPAKTVDQLTINTLGKSNVNIKNFNVKQISGKLSDSTTVSMPFVYARQLMK